MTRMSKWFGLAVLGVSLTGCVSQEQYRALKLDHDRLVEQLAKSQSDLNTAQSEAEVYKQQLAGIMSKGDVNAGLIANLNNQSAEYQRQLADLQRKYEEAMGLVAKGGTALPQQLSNELSAFAAANPDLVDFDAARGVVKFKSDVTFATGSADLTPKAREVITRFTAILNSSSANGYELLVAGHTDNVRVSNPQTIANGHKDNWFLSAHRAISVGQAMLSHSVNAQRLGVAGYADQRPIASNASDSGRSQNRRVEVLILPTTVRGAVASTPAAAPAPAPKKVSQPLLNKDSASTDNRPYLNK